MAPVLSKPLPSYFSHSLISNPSVLEQFLAPVLHVLHDYTRGGFDCPAITDEDFLRLGCLRVLAQVRSGRDFIQQQQEVFDRDLKRASFFNLLHSSRRGDLLAECAYQLFLHGSQRVRQQGADLLAAFPALQGRAVWAADGHHIAHACHALRDHKGGRVPPKSLYLLCLHTGLLHNLCPVQGEGVWRHEMPVFRERLPAWLQRRPGRKGSRPPILVLDPAFVDQAFWSRMKQLGQAGAVMITRLKANMRPIIQGDTAWDRHAPINQGVQSDCWVRFDHGGRLRRIEYVDPETGETYVFLTTVEDLEPGLLAWLYLLRWRIEKVFDTGKNKLQETKAWASGEVAQGIQGHFFALTHNLLVLFRSYLQAEHGLEEVKLKVKHQRALAARQARAQQNGRAVHPLHAHMPAVVQLSLQFIRSLRNAISRDLTLAAALPRLNAMLTAYL